MSNANIISQLKVELQEANEKAEAKATNRKSVIEDGQRAQREVDNLKRQAQDIADAIADLEAADKARRDAEMTAVEPSPVPAAMGVRLPSKTIDVQDPTSRHFTLADMAVPTLSERAHVGQDR